MYIPKVAQTQQPSIWTPKVDLSKMPVTRQQYRQKYADDLTGLDEDAFNTSYNTYRTNWWKARKADVQRQVGDNFDKMVQDYNLGNALDKDTWINKNMEASKHLWDEATFNKKRMSEYSRGRDDAEANRGWWSGGIDNDWLEEEFGKAAPKDTVERALWTARNDGISGKVDEATTYAVGKATQGQVAAGAMLRGVTWNAFGLADAYIEATTGKSLNQAIADFEQTYGDKGVLRAGANALEFLTSTVPAMGLGALGQGMRSGRLAMPTTRLGFTANPLKVVKHFGSRADTKYLLKHVPGGNKLLNTLKLGGHAYRDAALWDTGTNLLFNSGPLDADGNIADRTNMPAGMAFDAALRILPGYVRYPFTLARKIKPVAKFMDKAEDVLANTAVKSKITRWLTNSVKGTDDLLPGIKASDDALYKAPELLETAATVGKNMIKPWVKTTAAAVPHVAAVYGLDRAAQAVSPTYGVWRGAMIGTDEQAEAWDWYVANQATDVEWRIKNGALQVQDGVIEEAYGGDIRAFAEDYAAEYLQHELTRAQVEQVVVDNNIPQDKKIGEIYNGFLENAKRYGVLPDPAVLAYMSNSTGVDMRLSTAQEMELLETAATKMVIRSRLRSEGKGIGTWNLLTGGFNDNAGNIEYAMNNIPAFKAQAANIMSRSIEDLARADYKQTDPVSAARMNAVAKGMTDVDMRRVLVSSGAFTWNEQQWRQAITNAGKSAGPGNELVDRMLDTAAKLGAQDPNILATVALATQGMEKTESGPFKLTPMLTKVGEEVKTICKDEKSALEYVWKLDGDKLKRLAKWACTPTGQDALKDAPEGVRTLLTGTLKTAAEARLKEMWKADPIGMTPFMCSLWMRQRGMTGLADLAENPLGFYGGLIAILGIGGIALSSLFDGGDDDDDEEEENERSSSGIDYSQFVEAMNNGW